jgi:hypothetical protein
VDIHNALQQMLRAPHAIPDPDDAGYIDVDRDRFYVSLVNAGTTETRTLRAPLQAGLVGHIGCITAGTSITVTVKDSGGSTTGTMVFDTDATWVGLISVELTAGVYSWQVTDNYDLASCSVQAAQNWSAAVASGTMTNLSVATGITALAASIGSVSIGASNITALTGVYKSINCSTGMTAAALSAPAINATSVTAGTVAVSSNLTAANLTATGINATSVTVGTCNVSSNLQAASILATNLSVGTGVTANGLVVGTAGMTMTGGNRVEGVAFASSGGSTNTAAMQLPNAPCVMLNCTSAGAFYKLPTSAVGLACNVVNVGCGSAIIIGGVSTQSIHNVTTRALGVSSATSAALRAICDGTNWWHRQ